MTTRYVYGRSEYVAYEVLKKGEPPTRIVVHTDEPWDANDPAVKARPDLFADAPLDARGTEQPVETSSARPGQKSTARRVGG